MFILGRSILTITIIQGKAANRAARRKRDFVGDVNRKSPCTLLGNEGGTAASASLSFYRPCKLEQGFDFACEVHIQALLLRLIIASAEHLADHLHLNLRCSM